jgi:TPR repeat protein
MTGKNNPTDHTSNRKELEEKIKKLILKSIDGEFNKNSLEYTFAFESLYGLALEYMSKLTWDKKISKEDLDKLILEDIIKHANQGYVKAKNYLNRIHQQKKHIDKLIEIAEQGDVVKQFYLSYLYSDEANFQKDSHKEFYWCKKAADQGHIQACNNLGNMYYHGEGVESNHKEAFKYYMIAADAGYLGSKFNLADMYFFGEGVDQDYKTAIKLYTEVANQGHVKAQFNLSVIYKDGILEGDDSTGNFLINKDEKKSKYWFDKACGTDS